MEPQEELSIYGGDPSVAGQQELIDEDVAVLAEWRFAFDEFALELKSKFIKRLLLVNERFMLT